MGAEEHDIVARVSGAGAMPDGSSASTGALAAHLAQACGHVSIDERVIAQGYRFHPEISDEIPAFFNRLIRIGSTTVAVTLLGGICLEDGSDAFAGCRTTTDARRVLASGDHHASLWRASITVEVRSLAVRDLAAPLFIARHPNEFRVVAEELVSVGALPAHACPICSELDEDDDADAALDFDL